MSKERAQRRAEREAVAAAARLRAERRRERELARRRRRRFIPRRKVRVRSARSRERRATIGSVLLVVLVVTWLMSRSVATVIGVMLVAAIATPAIVTALSDRSKK